VRFWYTATIVTLLVVMGCNRCDDDDTTPQGDDDVVADDDVTTDDDTTEDDDCWSYSGGSYVGTSECADAAYLGVNANHQAGYSVSLSGDLDGDGLDDIAIGAPNNPVNGDESGVVYLWYEPGSGTQDLAHADAVIHGSHPGALIGSSLAILPDTGGDGVGDLVVASPDGYGEVYVFEGPIVGITDLSQASAVIGAGDGSWSNASAVAHAGDVNQDDLADLVLGDTGSCEVYIVFGPISGQMEWGAADVIIETDADGDSYCSEDSGAVAGIGDFTGDGIDDVAIGRPSSGSSSGTVLVFEGPFRVALLSSRQMHGRRATEPRETTVTTIATSPVAELEPR